MQFSILPVLVFPQGFRLLPEATFKKNIAGIGPEGCALENVPGQRPANCGYAYTKGFKAQTCELNRMVNVLVELVTGNRNHAGSRRSPFPAG